MAVSSHKAYDNIRPMHSSDLECIYSIYDSAHLDEYSGEPVVFAKAPLQADDSLVQLLKDCEIFVFADGVVKGFVGARAERIIWLYVAPEHRGQGIGSQLIEFMLEHLVSERFIAISVVKSNQVALGLYQRKGFQIIGEFSFDYQGVAVQALGLMRIQDEHGTG